MKLSPLEPEDIDLLSQIENDTSNWLVSNTTVPYSKQMLCDYICSQKADIYAEKQLRLVIKDDNGDSIGLIDMQNFMPQHLRAEVGVAILASQRGKGYASRALEMLKDYAKKVCHIHQLYAIVPADNTVSIQLFEDCGFRQSALLNDWILDDDGKWQSAHLLQCFL